MDEQDNLWYVRQLESNDVQFKEQLLARLETNEGDHFKVFKQVFQERQEAGYVGDEIQLIETNEDLYKRAIKF